MRYGPASDAPTHLGEKQLGLPPEWLPDPEDGEVVTSAPRLGAARGVIVDHPPTHLTRPRTVEARSHSRSAAPGYTRVPTERSATPISVPSRRVAATPKHGLPAPVEPFPAPVVATRDRSTSENKSTSDKPSDRSKSAGQPQASAPQPPQAPSPPQMPAGIGAIDPLAVPVPPELGATIYGWIRRLAIQADLAGADRVLRDALLDLTSSLSVSIVYPGQDGLWSLGADEEIPREAQPLVAVAMARRAVVSSHTAIIPVVTTSETVAVITLTRNPRNPGYHPIEQLAMLGLAREAASILHHLAVQHLQRAAEIKADKGGLYRGEALEAHRSRGQEGVPVNLTPGWVKKTYPMLLLAITVAIVVSVFVSVPTYSTGEGFVDYGGTKVMSPAAGAVEQLWVNQGDAVKKGDVICRLQSADQQAELEQAAQEYKNLMLQHLADEGDEQVKKALANAQAKVDRAQALVDARVIRAPKSGTVQDRRVKEGQALGVGDHVLTIVDPGTLPEVVAVLPGSDLPRLKLAMKLQVELGGYKKIREIAEISFLGKEAIGADEVARFIGQQQADALHLTKGASYVIVKARLESNTFQTEQRVFNYFQGLSAKVEVKVRSVPFLVSLLPALEKYFPE